MYKTITLVAGFSILFTSSFVISRNLFNNLESTHQLASVGSVVSTSSSSTPDVVNKVGKTLCNIPKKIDNYVLQSSSVSNDSSQLGYGTFWDTGTGALYDGMTPKEDIMLIYKDDTAGSTSSVAVEMFRYETESDFRNDFEKKLMFEDTPKGEIINLGRSPHVKGYSRAAVAYYGTYVEAEVSKPTDVDARKVATEIMKVCVSAPLYDNGVPKGFSPWRTSDLYSRSRTGYLSVADVDLTIHLSNNLFGANPFVNDYSSDAITDFNAKVKHFKFYPVDSKGRMGSVPILLFVTNKNQKEKFVEILKTGVVFESGIDSSLKFKQSSKSTAYSGNKSFFAQKVNYDFSFPDSKEPITEHLYFVDSGNTSLVFLSFEKDSKFVESLINNTHITKLGEEYKSPIVEKNSQLAKAKKDILALVSKGVYKNAIDCSELKKKYINSLSIFDVISLTNSCNDAIANKILNNQKSVTKQQYNICGTNFVFEKVAMIKGTDLLKRFSILSNLKTVPASVCSDFLTYFKDKEIGVNKKEYDGANFLDFYPLYDKEVLNGQSTQGISLAFIWSDNIVNYFPSTLKTGDATYLGAIK